MMDGLVVLIVIIAAVSQFVQNAQEKKKKQAAKSFRKEQGERRPQSTSGVPVRQAKPKGAARSGPSTLEPNTTGKDLIDALFCEGASESMEGWTNVASPPPPPKQ